jgi:hypothetical protein
MAKSLNDMTLKQAARAIINMKLVSEVTAATIREMVMSYFPDATPKQGDELERFYIVETNRIVTRFGYDAVGGGE